MASEYRAAINYLESYIVRHGGNYGRWYVGIATNPKKRLAEHNASTVPWVYYSTTNDQVARDVESYFLDRLGTQGGKSGGDEKTRTVYAYRISTTTIE